MNKTWNRAQEWEADWWGKCLNTYGEEEKQLLYASRMGLKFFHNGKSPYNIDAGYASVIDVGGGPNSLLLKTVNRAGSAVLDPLAMPEWVKERYRAADIMLLQKPAEEFRCDACDFDEVWIYNCLQHTENPQAVIANARHNGRLIRIFEWIDTEVNIGHPHSLTKEMLDDLLAGYGKVEALSGQANCYGRCYYGIFPA